MNTYKYKPKNGTLDYPIAKNMDSNKPIINELINFFKETVEIRSDTIINLICRGSSGAIIASAFAMALDHTCKIVYVRKEAEVRESHSCHDSDLAPLYNGAAHNIIVDDFISSGETLNKIHAKIMEFYPETKINGVVVNRGSYNVNFQSEYFITT